MRARLFLALALVGGVAQAASPAAHSFSVDDLLHLGRLGGWDVSRDGRRVIFTVRSFISPPDFNPSVSPGAPCTHCCRFFKPTDIVASERFARYWQL